MTAAVVIPYGGKDAYRERGLGMVLAYYASELPSVKVVVSTNHGRYFNRSQAVNTAVVLLPPEVDMLIINDADTLVPLRQLRAAVRLAAKAPGLVRAYSRYRRLSQYATDRLATYRDLLAATDADIHWQQDPAYAHGAAVIQRSCFEEAGGYDPKFSGWGYEDMAFELALDARWADRRVQGDLFHHWHPLAADPESEQRNADLYYNRYEPLRGNAEALLALRRMDA